MDFLQTIFKTSYGPAVTKSKGMQKSPEFDAKYDPIVIKSKGTVWPSNVVPAEIIRRPPGDPPQGVSGFCGLNHW